MNLLQLILAAFCAACVLASTSEPGYATVRPPSSTISPSLSSIWSARQTVLPSSPTSNVQGAAFDRIIQVWLENTDFEAASADPNLQWIASQGITLTNYYAVTHPSQPNYIAAVGGDTFGMDHDAFVRFPENISTVVDLLDTKGISWGEYQEDIPYPGYPGFNFSDQQTYANNYVRKHNPLINFDSVANNATRTAQIKSFEHFLADIATQRLPQWSFVTPNMLHDAHDTNITFAATWTRKILQALVENLYLMNNTLIILTFDENEVYPKLNRVFTVLLGGAVDKSLHGTVDDLYYNHYSTISTVSVNWGLPSLGRWDCEANVFGFVADKAGYKNTNISLDGLYFNVSYPGAVSDNKYTAGWWPVPDTLAKCAAGKGVLDSIVSVWGNSSGTYNYTNVFPYDEPAGVNTTPSATVPSPTAGGGTGSPSATTPIHSSTPASPADTVKPGMEFMGIVGLIAAFML